MLETLTREIFAPHVGDTFHIHLPDNQSVEATLVETNALSAATTDSASAVRAPFSLLFKGPATPLLPQQIYRLDHLALGQFDLFIVPLGPSKPAQGAPGLLYEAVFT